VIPELAPQEGDIVLEKVRWDFFLYTELDAVLKNLGVKRVIVTGVNTNCCVETTARTAMQLNYEVAVATDACSSDEQELHDNALKSMKVLYIEVAPWRDLLNETEPWTRNTAIGYGHDELY
jgi:ureidoacrylate peracid hydrolase